LFNRLTKDLTATITTEKDLGSSFQRETPYGVIKFIFTPIGFLLHYQANSENQFKHAFKCELNINGNYQSFMEWKNIPKCLSTCMIELYVSVNNQMQLVEEIIQISRSQTMLYCFQFRCFRIGCKILL